MTPLKQKVYTLLKTVPKGRVTTYKALADALGTKAYRAIGQMMRNNPYGYVGNTTLPHSDLVPCHRVVASDGTLGGFMGKSDGLTLGKKIKLLHKEGIEVSNNKITDFDKVLYRFSK